MKKKLTLSIDNEKVKQIKCFAKANNTSVSKLIEEQIDRLRFAKSKKKLNPRELVGLFGKASKDFNADEIRWQHLKKKHGL
jgi:hypothetical protein